MFAQLVNITIGLWIMVAPAVLGYAGAPANNDHVVGPLVVTFATIALWEATRAVRWMNLVFGAWMVAASWLLGYSGRSATAAVCAGVALAVFSLPRGRLSHSFAGGWRVLWRQ